MKIKALLIGLFLAVTAQAHAANYYFSSSASTGSITVASSNSNPCTLAAPCNDLKGTTLDNAGALSPGDIIWVDGGDSWTTTTAEWQIVSNGTAANPIVMKKYDPSGTHDDPKFYGLQLYASGWTACTSSSTPACPSAGAYYMTGISFTNSELYTVTQGDDKALFRYGYGYGTNTLANLPEGHFWFAGGSEDRVYVRLWGDLNPNTLGTVRIPNFIHYSGDGRRGIICSGCGNGSYGDYVEFEDLNIIGANGVGFSVGGVSNRSRRLNIVGAGRDGWLAMYGQIAGEDGSDYIDEGSTVSYSAAGGTGYGQGWTTYAPRGLWYQSTAHHNAMAGFDWLKGTIAVADVQKAACKLCTSHDNGIWGDSRSYDANYYIDAGHDVLIKDSICYNGGGGADVSTGGSGNDRPCINMGSELPSSYAAYNLYIINNLIYNTNYQGLATGNLPSTTANVTGIYLIGNTVISRRSTSETNYGFFWGSKSSAVDGFIMRNNIFYGENGSYISGYVDSGTYLDADYNLYYMEGGSSTIYSTNGGGSGALTFSQWKTASGEDNSSVNADPKFINDTQGAFDVHLAHTATGQVSTSPAVDAGMASAWSCPTWVYTQWPSYFPECASGQNPFQGTTRSDGVADSGTIDIGYHYPLVSGGTGSLTSANVEPSSLETGTVSSHTISFTNTNTWTSDGKLKVIYPSNLGNWTFNSGATTTATCSSGCNGTLSVSVSGNTLTLTRGGAATATSAGTAIVIALNSSVANPSSAGTTDPYYLETQTSSGTAIDTNGSVSGDTFTAPAAPPSGGTRQTISGTITFSGTITLR